VEKSPHSLNKRTGLSSRNGKAIVLKADSAYSAKSRVATAFAPFKNPEMKKRFLEHLLAAGLPE
jgi:hypothetical protein